MEKFKLENKKSFFFTLAIFIQLILMFLLFLDGTSYLTKNIGLAYAEFALSFTGSVALVFIYFFRKFGVYFYAAVLFFGFIINPYKSDLLFSIFFFIGIGLATIIPRWNLFK
jgi:hypothetical protein